MHHVILHVLPLWPKPSTEELAAARPARAARARRTVEHAHLWVGGNGRWHCRFCLAATFSVDGVYRRRCKEECPRSSSALRHVFQGGGKHRLMVADVQGAPCAFCAACGAWCITKPRVLLLPCLGRTGRTTAALAALTRFRSGFVPDCGGKVARKVYAILPLHSEAADLGASIPLEERSCARLRAAQGHAKATCDEPPRFAADRDADLLAKFGDDDPIDCTLRAATA